MGENIKINNETRWDEKPLRPTIQRPITKRDIEEFHTALCQSYACKQDEITYGYDIMDRELHPEEWLDYVWLVFKLKCIDQERRVVERLIYKSRVEVPPEIKSKIKTLIDSGKIKI